MRLWMIVLCLVPCVFAQAEQTGPIVTEKGFSLSSGPLQGLPRVDALAAKPYRPTWAPLPILRDRVDFVPFLHGELAATDAETRAQTAFLLGQIGYRGSAKLLARGLSDPERSVRVQCGIALARLGDARGVATCASALRSDLPWIRYYAACGLWRVGTPTAKRVLRESLPGQGKLVTRAIEGALSTRLVLPPATHLPKAATKLTWDDVMQVACDECILEGDWWWHQGDFEQGIRCTEALVFLDPSDVESFGVIAWLQRSLGRESESVATLKRCVAANSMDPNAYFELGFHYMTDDKFALAEPYLRRSVELGGDHLCIRQYANCLEKLGKLKEAYAQWSRVLEMRPEDPAARFNCDRLKGLLGADG